MRGKEVNVGHGGGGCFAFPHKSGVICKELKKYVDMRQTLPTLKELQESKNR
jgi:hypothetical protein